MTSEHDRPGTDRPGGHSMLRRLAEEAERRNAASSPEDVEALSSEEIRRRFHELRVHQIELEMQNVQLRQAQVALEASQARYFDLYDMAPVGYCTISEQGLILEANLKAATLLGLTRGKLTGQPFSPRFISKEDQGDYYLLRKRLFETGEPQSCELRMVKWDGTVFWTQLSTTLVPDETGSPLCRIVLTDITERKRFQEYLEVYRKIVTSIPDRVAFVDKNYRYVIANEVYERFSGVSSQDIIGMKVADVVGEEMFRRTVKPDFERCLQGEDVNYQEWFNYPAMGKRLVDISYHPYRDAHNNITGIVSLIKDITEKKRAEDALRLFIEHAPAAIAMFDRNLRYLSASRRWSNHYGLGDRDLSGLSIYEVGEIDERWQEAHRRGLAGEVVRLEENRYERPDGSVQWLRWEIRPWYDLPEYIGGIVIFTEDITIRKQFAEQLQALNDELELRVERRTLELQETHSQLLHAEKLSAIGQLSASIAHEFNNPLQTVMTVLKGLRRILLLEGEDSELLDAAIGESERMKNLIRNLQSFNRPSSGKKIFMDVHASLDSLLLLCKSDFKRKGISTVRDYAERLPQILAIPDQIKQVFLNLLNNAADACLPSDGVITIRTWFDEKSVAVAIQDNGVGISPERMGRIFQPFYTTKPEVKGTGLGLSVCHGIVKKHQGEIRVESQPGKGSIFTVLLPVKGE